MEYEVIRDIKNQCKNNSMRDIFFEEIETDDPDKWIREQEPFVWLELLRTDGKVAYGQPYYFNK